MDFSNQEPPEAAAPKKKKGFRLVVGAFLALFVLVAGVVLWNAYFGPNARRERELQKNLELAQKTLSNLEEEARADIYGGATPEETLRLFIEALQKEDFELASKYFSLSSTLSREEWKAGLEDAKSEGRLNSVVDIVSRAVPDESVTTLEDSAWFVVLSKKNPQEIEADINLHFNSYSGVWKIESL